MVFSFILFISKMQKQPPFYKYDVFKNLRKIYRKATMPESAESKIAGLGLQVC